MKIRKPVKFFQWGALVLLLGSSSAWSHTFCDQVCTSFDPVGDHYLILVTDVETGNLLEVQRSDIPSNLAPTPGGGPGDGGGPILIPHGDGPILIPHGSATPMGADTSDVFIYTFRGPEFTWTVATTLVFDHNGDLFDVHVNVSERRNGHEETQ